MNKGLNVLSIGSSQANFLVELYGNISHKSNSKIKFTLSGKQRFKKDIVYSFEDLISYQEVDLKQNGFNFSLIKLFFKLLFDRKKFKSTIGLRDEIGLLVLQSNLRFKSLLQSIRKVLNQRYYGNKVIRPIYAQFDTVHVQFLMLKNIAYSWYIPTSTKVICTFWGSDLMRNAGLENTFYVSHLLKRADLITAQSLEMREILLSKFGREFHDKFKPAMFALPEKLFDVFDSLVDDETKKKAFLKSLNLDWNKKTIVIGHNGSKFNNHIPVIEALLMDETLDLNEYNLILPFTYMPDGETYKAKVLEAIKKVPNCVILEDYLSWKNLAILRLSTDFYIHVPQSDAMSGALTESIYAGAVPIVGSWLPYENYSRCNIALVKINHFNEIADKIKNPNYDQTLDVKANINKFLRGDAIYDNWISLYNTMKE